MYVRKFEADTLDKALQDIKGELGPDAIILKTKTNKGLKGAFKKKKIEITAAISERSYVKKAKVDEVLGPEHKKEFYKESNKSISGTIDTYNNSKATNYGNLGLNKAVKNATETIKSGLDEFLGKNDVEKKVIATPTQKALEEEFYEDEPAQPAQQVPTYHAQQPVYDEEIKEELEDQQSKIADLEQKLFDLTHSLENRNSDGLPRGIKEVRASLKTLDICEKFILELVKKIGFELSREEQENPDTVFDLALREMAGTIKVGLPLFSKPDADESPTVTVLVSEVASGQTSTALKLATLKKGSVVVQVGGAGDTDARFYKSIFDLDIEKATNPSEAVSMCRNAVQNGKSVFLDYRNTGDKDETKNFCNGLKRSFDEIEILLCLSSIQSELYNQKTIKKYQELCSGITVSHIDLCLNFGALFNLNYQFSELPFIFFGTGSCVPEDLEAASSERILGKLFQFDI